MLSVSSGQKYNLIVDPDRSPSDDKKTLETAKMPEGVLVTEYGPLEICRTFTNRISCPGPILPVKNEPSPSRTLKRSAGTALAASKKVNVKAILIFSSSLSYKQNITFSSEYKTFSTRKVVFASGRLERRRVGEGWGCFRQHGERRGARRSGGVRG
jgi:hypothetical protein